MANARDIKHGVQSSSGLCNTLTPRLLSLGADLSNDFVKERGEQATVSFDLTDLPVSISCCMPDTGAVILTRLAKGITKIGLSRT